MRLANFKGELLPVEGGSRCGNESHEGHEAAIPAIPAPRDRAV